jgi:hypothetical protein
LTASPGLPTLRAFVASRHHHGETAMNKLPIALFAPFFSVSDRAA